MLELTGKRNIFLAISVTILLGVVSNGLWELLIKPSITWLRDVLLNIASLGIESIKNACYAEIAKGFHEAIGLQILAIITIIIFLAAGYYMGHVGNRYIHRRDNSQKEQQFIDSIPNKTKLILLLCLCYVIFSLMILNLTQTRISYINSAISYYHQLHKIVRPYISEENSILLDSQFSRIAKKDDYVAVLSQLYEICDKNKITYTKFSAW